MTSCFIQVADFDVVAYKNPSINHEYHYQSLYPLVYLYHTCTYLNTSNNSYIHIPPAKMIHTSHTYMYTYMCDVYMYYTDTSVYRYNIKEIKSDNSKLLLVQGYII